MLLVLLLYHICVIVRTGLHCTAAAVLYLSGSTAVVRKRIGISSVRVEGAIHTCLPAAARGIRLKQVE